MKRIVASIGVAAIGSAVLPATHAQPVSLSPQESTKPWSVGVALRGFYDDNYTYAPRGSANIPDSFGFEVRPTLGLNVPLEQTYIGLDLTYSGMWYEDRSENPWDQTFLANGILSHAFTEQMNLEVKDQFVYSDRPELLDPNFSTVVRTDDNNIYNRGNIQYSLGVSPRLGFVVGYENSFWDYQNDNPAAVNTPPPPGTSASLSALLGRMQQLIPINLRHQTGPSTVTFIGYSYGMVNYTSDEYLYSYAAYGIPVPPGGSPGPKADSRNYRSHYGYVGVEHNFTPVLSLGARGGVQYSDFYNLATSDTTLTPYGDLSVDYLYTVGSKVEVGYTLSQASTDQAAPAPGGNGTPTLNRLVSSLYARVDHQFIPQLHGGAFAQWQYSVYNGGAYDGENDNLYLLGLSLRYTFNQFLSGDLGYTLDYQDSQIPGQGYTRNYVYIGVTASY